MFLPILFSLIPQIIPEQVPPYISHIEAQYVGLSLINALESESPTVEKLGRAFTNPCSIAGMSLTLPTVVNLRIIKNQNENRKFIKAFLQVNEMHNRVLFEDRKAILYYRTKQYENETFEKVYDEYDAADFKFWAEKYGGETLIVDEETKKELNQNIYNVQRNFGSFNFTFHFEGDIFSVVNIGKSFYINSVDNELDFTDVKFI